MKKVNYIKFKQNEKLVNISDINNLKKIFKKTKLNSRICIHKNVNDNHQEMIIIQGKKNFFPPKKNIKSDQTFLIIEGKLLIIIFDNFGNIISKNILSKKKNLLVRVKKNTYHCDIPLTKYAIQKKWMHMD